MTDWIVTVAPRGEPVTYTPVICDGRADALRELRETVAETAGGAWRDAEARLDAYIRRQEQWAGPSAEIVFTLDGWTHAAVRAAGFTGGRV